MSTFLNFFSRWGNILTIIFCTLSSTAVQGQDIGIINPLLTTLSISDHVPDGLLSSRSIVIFPLSSSNAERMHIQQTFLRSGIDAVCYISVDAAFANIHTQTSLAQYLRKRNVTFLIFLSHQKDEIVFYFTAFNKKETLVNKGQNAWRTAARGIDGVLNKIHSRMEIIKGRTNYLINEYPETNFTPVSTRGKSSPFFPLDLKIDALAVVGMHNATGDSTLRKLLRKYYPYQFVFLGSDVSIDSLKRAGYIYSLDYIYANDSVSRALVNNNSLYSSTSPLRRPTYKFYIEHTVSGEIFWGTSWDASPTWDVALWRYIDNFKEELGL